MDERLEAGRRHLAQARQALDDGRPQAARPLFESAMLQFRSPELRLGEAHALRGLAQVASVLGDTVEAERLAREAVTAYRALSALLQRLDEKGLADEVRAEARDGEASSLVLLGDLLVRIGRNDEAREVLAWARDIYEGGHASTSAAAVWNAMGHLATREGRFGDASQALERSMGIHHESGDLPGKVGVLLSKAELCRLQNDLQGAERALDEALPLARAAGSPGLEGLVLASMGSSYNKGSLLGKAQDRYREALVLARQVGDTELEAKSLLGLGEVKGKLGEPQAIDLLLDGARIMASQNNVHGLAGALWRIGGHGLRFGEPALALVAGEAARRLWSETDPVRGVGMALRIVVKALAALKQWEAVLLAAMSRAVVAGEDQPNALAVADFYKARAPQELVEGFEALERADLVRKTADRVVEIIGPDLQDAGLAPEALDTVSGALEVVSVRAARLPRPAPPHDWDELGFHSDEEPSAQPSVEGQGLDRPPTDETPRPPHRVARPLEGPKKQELLLSRLSAPAPGYEGLYEPPDLDVDEDEESLEEDSSDERSVEDTLEVPQELRGAPPAGYDYLSPFEE